MPRATGRNRYRTLRTAAVTTAAAVVLLAAVAACSTSGLALSSSASPTSASTDSGSGGGAGPIGGAISVVNGQLERDGRAWEPHGLVDVAFVAPPKAATGVFATAYQEFSPAEMTAARAWGADTIRFQVSQPGLDPQNTQLFDPTFRAKMIAGVRAARKAGLNVIVSVQDESQSGEQHPTALPDPATQRVWTSLAREFNNDPGIMYEMLNEPSLTPSPQNWTAWAAAMNQTIATIRATGSHNVVVADGLLEAERLDGAPDLSDPDHAVVYASHPYAHDASGQNENAWNTRFGDFARTHPVIVTEWTTIPSYFCNSDTPNAAARFIGYLKSHDIGITAFALDFSGDKFGSVAYGPNYTPSTYVGTQCGSAGFGPGSLLQSWYRQVNNGQGQDGPPSAASQKSAASTSRTTRR